MLDRKVRNLALIAIAIVSAAVPTALSATGASAATSAAARPGHTDVAATTVPQASSARPNTISNFDLATANSDPIADTINWWA
jgi:hypothetical protein